MPATRGPCPAWPAVPTAPTTTTSPVVIVCIGGVLQKGSRILAIKNDLWNGGPGRGIQ